MQEVFEKIIQRLRTEKNMDRSLVYSTEQCDAIRYAFGAAIDAVKVCVEEYNNGWIPCSERLPGKTEHYLVTTDNHTKPMYAWWKRYEKRWFYFNSTVEMLDVIAWQPLPEPYQPKGDKHGNEK